MLGVFRDAVYLAVDGGVLPLVAAGGLRLPTGLWLPGTLGSPTALGSSPGAPGAPVAWGVHPGCRVPVGAGEVRLPQVTVRAVRTWLPQRVPVAGAVGGLPVAHSALREVARELARAALAAPADGKVDRVVGRLVGAGPGLTPSGDDVLCGLLLGLRLSGRPEAVARLWGQVAPRLASTTALSAALLREAAEGYAVPPVVALTTALADGEPREVERRVAEVLAIGHTSGADLLAGLAGALDAAAAPRGAEVGSRDAGALINAVDQCPSIATVHLSLPMQPGRAYLPARSGDAVTVAGAQ